MERKLASIQRVLSVVPIETKDGVPADNIQEITVLGWKLVAKKGQFKVGDLCVYFELDSTLDPNLEWVQHNALFLTKSNFRIKTMKLNNMRVLDTDGDLVPVISQGLALPLDILENLCDNSVLEEGQDVTQILGVTKYEAPIKFFAGDMAGSFPAFIPKTDETRIQSVPDVLKELSNKPYYITLKVDGSSLTAWWDSENGLRVASRNFERKNDGNVYWQAALRYKLDEVLKDKPNIAIQGEVVGKSIQGNLLGIEDIDLYVFNIFNIETGQYFDMYEMVEFCSNNNLQMVEILEVGVNFSYTLPELEEYCKGNYDFTTNPREGIVVRSTKNMYSKWLLGRLSFKCINVDYLLMKGE